MDFLKLLVRNLTQFVIGCILTAVAAAIMAPVIIGAIEAGASPLVCWAAYGIGVLFGILFAVGRLFATE